MGESIDDSTGNANVWQTPLDGVSGTFTITTLTATHLTATFEYVTAADDNNDIGGTRTVTEGEIDLPFDGALKPVPENKGGKVSATLGGAPYNAWSINGSLMDFTGNARREHQHQQRGEHHLADAAGGDGPRHLRRQRRQPRAPSSWERTAATRRTAAGA